MGLDDHTAISRRTALRRIGAGAALAWSAPVVVTVGASAIAGSPAPGTCSTVHSNGLGQSFTDCSPTGTYNVDSATEACTAYTGNATLCAAKACGGGANDVVCGAGPQGCACWQFAGTATGHVSPPAGNAAGCVCPSTTNPMWN